MKDKILLGLFLMIMALATSQNHSKEKAIELIAQDICEAFNANKEKFSPDKSLKEREIEMGLLLIKFMNKRKKESKELKKYLSKEGFEKVGEEVGMQIAFECGDLFMQVFSADELFSIADEDENHGEKIKPQEVEVEMLPPPPSPKAETDLTMIVTLKSIHNDAVSYLKFSDSFGKEHDFIIKNQFEGKELINAQSIGKEFTVYYIKSDFYDISEDGYVKKKVIKYIELL